MKVESNNLSETGLGSQVLRAFDSAFGLPKTQYMSKTCPRCERPFTFLVRNGGKPLYCRRCSRST